MTAFSLALSPNAARYNLRDYGGYRTASGARLTRGRLFRSGQLDYAGPEDGGLLARLGIGTVIDLRSGREVGALSAAYAGYTGPVLTAQTEDGVIPHAVDAIMHLTALDDVRAHMVGIYRALPGSARFRESLRLYFTSLAQGDAANLIHCFAGKDRTGLAVALFHLAMGVHADDVFADYLLTNAAGEARIEAGLAVLRRTAPPGVSEQVLREVMEVRPEYLSAALAVVRAEQESPVAWVCQAAGLEVSAMEGLAARLLV